MPTHNKQNVILPDCSYQLCARTFLDGRMFTCIPRHIPKYFTAARIKRELLHMRKYMNIYIYIYIYILYI